MTEPGVQFVNTKDGVTIGYTVQGEGYPMVHMAGPPFSHVQQEAVFVNYSVYNNAVGHNRKIIRFDSRGTGMSERKIGEYTLDGLVSDLEAVVDRLGLERFGLGGGQGAGIIAIAYATAHPERVSHLWLLDAYVNGTKFLEIPQARGFLALALSDFNLFTESLAHFFFGWDAGEPARQYAAFLRDCVEPDTAARFFEWVGRTDVSDRLSSIKVPAVVFQHKSTVIPDMSTARQLATNLPRAELVVLEHTWNDTGDDPETLDRALTRLLGQEQPTHVVTASRAGGLVTILFTDIEGSTALTQRLGDVRAREVFREHERITREALSQHGGSEVKTMGDGFMASFPSASSAIESAIAMQRAFAEYNESSEARVNVRIGLNAGEPIAEEEDLFGTAVITASRIAAQAQGGEILASNVVRELVAGKRFMFADRGETVLRGFEDPVRVYEVRWGEGA